MTRSKRTPITIWSGARESKRNNRRGQRFGRLHQKWCGGLELDVSSGAIGADCLCKTLQLKLLKSITYTQHLNRFTQPVHVAQTRPIPVLSQRPFRLAAGTQSAARGISRSGRDFDLRRHDRFDETPDSV